MKRTREKFKRLIWETRDKVLSDVELKEEEESSAEDERSEIKSSLLKCREDVDVGSEAEYLREIESLASRITEMESLQIRVADFTTRLGELCEEQNYKSEVLKDLEVKIEERQAELAALESEIVKLKRERVDVGEISEKNKEEKLKQEEDSVSRRLIESIENLIEMQHKQLMDVNEGMEEYLPVFNGQLPRFSASQNPEDFKNVEIFIRELEFAMPSNQWNEKQRVIGGLSALEGEVLNQIRSLPECERNTWIKFKSLLRERFSLSEKTLALLKRNFRPRRKLDEDFLSFLFRVRSGLMNFDPSGVWSSERRVSEFIDIVECETPPEVCPLLYLLTDVGNTTLRRFSDAWRRILNKKSSREKSHPFEKREACLVIPYGNGGRNYPGGGGRWPTRGRKYLDRGHRRTQEHSRRRRYVNYFRCYHRERKLNWQKFKRCYQCQKIGHLARDCGEIAHSKNASSRGVVLMGGRVMKEGGRAVPQLDIT